MASTITFGTTIRLTSQFIHNAPLLYVNDGALAYSMGDYVRQFILAPPFAWRWNRGFVDPITCSAGESDYSVTIPDFGYIEKATLIYPPVSGNSVQQSKELTVQNVLVGETILGQPAFISVIDDDGNGNITFRLMQVPDVAYTLIITYQKAAPVFQSVKDTWAPIPDYYSYLYNMGMLSQAYEYKSDERFAFAHQQFLKMVVSASEGLTDTEKNIFLESRLITTRESQSVTQNGQISRLGRSGQ